MIIYLQENGILAVNNGTDESVVPDGVDYKTVESVPKSRIFRNAWTFNDEIGIDKAKAKNITKDVIREWRKPQLESLDVQFQRALETGADNSDIIKQKQLLRDYTDKADGKTVKQLTTIIEGLNNGN
jgi:uncharacterized membrane protein